LCIVCLEKYFSNFKAYLGVKVLCIFYSILTRVLSIRIYSLHLVGIIVDIYYFFHKSLLNLDFWGLYQYTTFIKTVPVIRLPNLRSGRDMIAVNVRSILEILKSSDNYVNAKYFYFIILPLITLWNAAGLYVTIDNKRVGRT